MFYRKNLVEISGAFLEKKFLKKTLEDVAKKLKVSSFLKIPEENFLKGNAGGMLEEFSETSLQYFPGTIFQKLFQKLLQRIPSGISSGFFFLEIFRGISENSVRIGRKYLKNVCSIFRSTFIEPIKEL